VLAGNPVGKDDGLDNLVNVSPDLLYIKIYGDVAEAAAK
tara:strand:- start:579 stop:695 length:117 start_codon:yes stop_codon:yes gene_type:complete